MITKPFTNFAVVLGICLGLAGFYQSCSVSQSGKNDYYVLKSNERLIHLKHKKNRKNGNYADKIHSGNMVKIPVKNFTLDDFDYAMCSIDTTISFYGPGQIGQQKRSSLILQYREKNKLEKTNILKNQSPLQVPFKAQKIIKKSQLKTQKKERDENEIEKKWEKCGLNYHTALKKVKKWGFMGSHYFYSGNYFAGILNFILFFVTCMGIIALTFDPASALTIIFFYGGINFLWWRVDVGRVKKGALYPRCYTSQPTKPSKPQKILLNPVVFSGSKADGTLQIGYEISPIINTSNRYDLSTGRSYTVYEELPISWDMYDINRPALEKKALEYCQNWGYKGINFFESVKRECMEYDKQNGVCYRYRFVYECQCTETSVNAGQNEEGSVKNQIKSLGTGFLISPEGYVITNYHVVSDIAGPDKIEVYDNFKKTVYKAKVIAKDIRNDLALIKIENGNFTVPGSLPYAISSKQARVGDEVFVIGYPDASVLGTEPKFVDGKISSLTGVMDDNATMQLTTPVYPGNSGSPLFDSDGNIIGIINAKYKPGDNVSYAIKKTALINLLEANGIEIPKNNSLKNVSLQDKIDNIKKYVYLIIIK